MNRYPDPSGERLKRRIRETMRIDPSLGILLGNGSDEILQLLSLVLAKPGAVVLAPEPSFVVYRLACLAHGVPFTEVALDDGYTHDLPAMARAVSGAR